MIESRPKRTPCCSRCKNHGLRIPTRGHLNNCDYKFCNCQKCQWTQERRVALNKDISQRRMEARAERLMNVRQETVRNQETNDGVNSLSVMSNNMERNSRAMIHEMISKHGESASGIFEEWMKLGQEILQHLLVPQQPAYQMHFETSPQSTSNDSNYQLMDLDLNCNFDIFKTNEKNEAQDIYNSDDLLNSSDEREFLSSNNEINLNLDFNNFLMEFF